MLQRGGRVKKTSFNKLQIYIYFSAQISEAKPSAPPVPNEENTLEFFDSVIASCDSEPKPHIDDGHADVDFIGE